MINSKKYSVQMPGDILERLPRQNVKVTISEALKIQKNHLLFIQYMIITIMYIYIVIII